jgi:DNA-binding MarR family transcriptional regulator
VNRFGLRSRPDRGNYVPLDEVLESHPVRVLRALRHFDWIDTRDVFDLALNAELNEITGRQSVERSALSQAIVRLVRRGLAERQQLGANVWVLRITAAGRRALARCLTPDTRIATSDELAETEDACA